MTKLKEYTQRFRKEVMVYKEVLKDKRTSGVAKFFIALAIGYAITPFDLIPDFIPVIGQLDDIVLVPFFIFLAHAFIPKELMEEKRRKIN